MRSNKSPVSNNMLTGTGKPSLVSLQDGRVAHPLLVKHGSSHAVSSEMMGSAPVLRCAAGEDQHCAELHPCEKLRAHMGES